VGDFHLLFFASFPGALRLRVTAIQGEDGWHLVTFR
jgi:hypothetical protein